MIVDNFGSYTNFIFKVIETLYLATLPLIKRCGYLLTFFVRKITCFLNRNLSCCDYVWVFMKFNNTLLNNVERNIFLLSSHIRKHVFVTS
jgi:hypothetical protein